MASRLTAFVVSAIVAVTFVAGLIVGAQREDDGGPADLIIHNARVYLGPSADAAEALAIRGGKIVRVGSNKEIDRLRRRQTMDAAGGTVTPGLNDAGLNLFEMETASASPTAVPPAPGTAPTTPGTATAEPPATPSTEPAPAPAQPSRDAKLDALRKAIKSAHSVGLTSVQTTISSPEDLALLSELRKDEELNLRVFVTLSATLPVDEASVDRLDAIRKQAVDDAELVKVGAVKLTPRATPDARAALKPRGNLRRGANDQLAVTQLADAITLLDHRHWQVIVETATAADVALAADAFERAFGEKAVDAIRMRRHRIDLAAPVDATLAARLTALELIPSLPASAIASASATAASAPASASPDTEPAALAGAGVGTGTPSPLTSFLSNPRAVVRSDWPTSPFDPLPTLVGAVAMAEPVESLTATLDAYTSHAAYASHDEQTKGTLAKDQVADLIIFSTDLFAASPDRPLDALVTTTIVDGKVVFTQPAPKTTRATRPANTEQ